MAQIDIERRFLRLQKAVLLRAVHRARLARADHDADVLLSIVALLEDLDTLMRNDPETRH